MRRPSIACRRAVQTLHPASVQYIWVPDDLLSRAVHQFFRVNCPHQKRYGSHVPGPLEATRRAAKRRMTAQANIYPQGGFAPPLFDFGALFGSRERKEPAWKYEPPSLCQGPINSPSTMSTLSLDAEPPPKPPATRSAQFFAATEPSPTLRSERNIAPAQEPSRKSDSTEQKSRLEDFQLQMITADTLSADERFKRLLDSYLALPTDETGGFSIRAFRYLDTHLGPHRAVSFLNHPLVHLPDIYTDIGLELLQILHVASAKMTVERSGIEKLYSTIARSALHAPSPEKSGQDARLRLIIRGLWDAALVDGEVTAVSTAALLRDLTLKVSRELVRLNLTLILEHPNNAVQQIAKLVMDYEKKRNFPTVEFLECIPRSLLLKWASALPALISTKTLPYWLKLSHQLDCRTKLTHRCCSLSDVAFEEMTKLYMGSQGSGVFRRLLLEALLYKLTRHISLVGVAPRMERFVTKEIPGLKTQQRLSIPLLQMVTRLVARFDEASLPNSGPVELMIPIMSQTRGVQGPLELLQQIAKSGTRLSHTTFLESFITHKVRSLKPFPLSESTTRDLGRHAFVLNFCRDLESVAIALGARNVWTDDLSSLEARRQFNHIIERANDAHVTPLAYRKLTREVPMLERAALIHHFAAQYSLDQTRTSRQNWRSLYYLYKYLHQYRQPMEPAFAQAIVRVCLIQPMSQQDFVSARRLRFVCRLVEKVEGEDAARKIEQIFWVWRGDLIKHAKQILIELGEPGRAHIRTMKRLGML